MTASGSEREPLGELADEFLDRCRRGERPSLTSFVRRHPELAEEIRELFPALEMMEDARPATRPAAPPPPLAVGLPFPRLGDYRLVREAGRGGMGVVYEAVQESLGRRVALKVLPLGATAHPTQVERFRREAKAAARLHHTNIVPVFGVGEEGGAHFYVMQYIEGRPLDEVLDEVRRLRDEAAPRAGAAPAPEPSPPDAEASSADVARSFWNGRFRTADRRRRPEASDPDQTTGPRNAAVLPRTTPDLSATAPPGASDLLTDVHRSYAEGVARIGVQAADALEYAAGQGVLHRDVRPSNLLLDMGGAVWLTDFGLAKASGTPDLTGTGDLLGTFRYLAPERFRGRADARSDVYALGLTLFELIALRPAFDEPDQAGLMRRITSDGVPRLDGPSAHVPRDLATIVHKATAKEAADRYQTAGALADDLRRFLDDRSITARRVGWPEQAWRWGRRKPALAASLAGTFAAVVAGAVASLLFAFGEKAARERADRRERDARDSATETRRQVEKLYVADGLKAEEDGDLFGAFLWFVKPLQGEHGAVVDEAMHRLRLGCYLRYAPRPTLLQVLAHDGDVTGAAFSPDGRLVVTASDDQTARVWDAATGKEVCPPLRHKGYVNRAAFSPDGRLVVTAGQDKSADLWDAATGENVASLPHLGAVEDAAFSQDGRAVITAGVDDTARVWEAATGRPLSPPLRHRGRVWRAAFSPDGRLVATASADGSARVWEAATGQPVTPPLRHGPGQVLSAAFSPDGRRLLSSGRDGTARLWDLSPDRRPAADLALLAQLLNGHRLDRYGASVPLSPAEQRDALAELRAESPAEFTVTPEQALAWRRREVEACVGERNADAALFHFLQGGLDEGHWPAGAPVRTREGADNPAAHDGRNVGPEPESRRRRLAVRDPDLAPVEPRQNEAVEALVVDAAVVAQHADRLLFPDEQALDAVGTEMHPRRVAPQDDVAGELVDLAAEGQLLPAPRLQGRAVGFRLDGLREDELLVEERLQHGDAGPCVGGVRGRVGRVRRAALGEGHGEQARAVARLQPGDGVARQDVFVEVVFPPPAQVGLDPPGERLRPQRAVDQPLVVVGPLLRDQRRLRQHREGVLAPEGDVAELGLGAAVRVGRGQRVFAEVEQDQRGVQVSLEAEVVVDELGQVPPGAEVARLGVEAEFVLRLEATLAGDPLLVVGQESLARGRQAVALFDGPDPVRHVEPEELAEVGAGQATGGFAAEKGFRREPRAGGRDQRLRERREVGDRRLDESVRPVLAEGDVGRQRLPIDLRHLAGHPGAGEGGRRRQVGGVAIDAGQVEGVSGLGVVQLDRRGRVAGDALERLGVAAGEDRQPVLVSPRFDLSDVVVRERLGEAGPPVLVAVLVAVGAPGRRRDEARPGGLMPQLVRGFAPRPRLGRVGRPGGGRRRHETGGPGRRAAEEVSSRRHADLLRGSGPHASGSPYCSFRLFGLSQDRFLPGSFGKNAGGASPARPGGRIL
jgi:serine/threonine protein kinase